MKKGSEEEVLEIVLNKEKRFLAERSPEKAEISRTDYDNYQNVWDDCITTERALRHDGYSILYNWFEDDGNSEVMFVSSDMPGQTATPSRWRGLFCWRSGAGVSMSSVGGRVASMTSRS